MCNIFLYNFLSSTSFIYHKNIHFYVYFSCESCESFGMQEKSRDSLIKNTIWKKEIWRRWNTETENWRNCIHIIGFFTRIVFFRNREKEKFFTYFRHIDLWVIFESPMFCFSILLPKNEKQKIWMWVALKSNFSPVYHESTKIVLFNQKQIFLLDFQMITS